MLRTAINEREWFDRDTAEIIEETTEWDGHNFVSNVTGSQWDHENVYITKGGKFVIHRYSQRQGVLDTYRVINMEEFVDWLLANKLCDDFDSDNLSAETVLAINKELESREI